MKKIFFSLLAIAAIASCAKTEAVYERDNSEIKIKPATALATKANQLAAIDGTEYPVAENFDVYGYWKDEVAGSSFTDGATLYLGLNGAVEFTNKGAYWGGKENAYYWPKNGSLRFAAYSPSSVDMEHDLATDTYSVDGYVQPNETAKTWDLLVAPASKSYTSMTAAENVSVVFEHALSWITVKVVAKDADAAKAFDIKKVTINDVVTTADLAAVMTEAKTEDKMQWTLTDTKAPVVVFNGSQAVTEETAVIETTADGTLVIPQPTTTITVDYTQNALPGTPALENQKVTVDLVLDTDNTPWKAGKHYVYTLVFGLDEILINPDVVDWDDVVVNEVEVGKTNIYSAEQLAEALTEDEGNIAVVLQEDIELPISSLGQITGGSGEYKLGGENTKNITIDLNGKKLDVKTTYWSALGAKNDDAVINIKNGTMTSTGNSAGTWNAYDLRFSNCNYVIEDVVFEKAIAFDNAGKSVILNNIEVTEDKDNYAIWITAEGQNVSIDGLSVETTGRGIKIDEQYVDAAALVTLKVKDATFQTAKKAAIVVKSVAGADITLENVDIASVVADTDFAVWVDEDSAAYADKVVVKGGLCKVEGSSSAAVVHAPAELDAAIKDGATSVYLAEGDYVIPSSAQGKTITFVGAGNPEDVSVAVTKVGTGGENCDYGLDGSTVVFENITITTNSSTYIGYARCNGTYKNCIINGTYTLYGNSVFENCTFNVSGDVYNIWTWGAPAATFTNCTFNSDGKALLLYGQENTKLTVNDCTFNDNGGLADLKAAIEIGNDYNKSYELVVNNTVVNGYEINDKGISTGTTLWANKNSMPKEKLNVIVDGVDVY